MVRIAPVNLHYNPKTLWFDAGDLDIEPGDGLVLSTARGTEFGRAAGAVFEADESRVRKLKTPLKPVKRVATDEDEAQAAEMERKGAEALPVFKEMAAEAGSDMHPVSVEYLLDGDKAVFYFEAEERVDFRDLVRKLASRFHVRIDMRQIGVRDEARMVGGLGHCGQELCCKRLGGEFCPVSIRMAKEQDLSLNPQKISGVCGRLMCCLRYEFDAYKDFKSRAPKQNSQVETPAGTAKVVDLDVPREIVSLKVEGEKPVRVPLADFDPPEEGSNRPKRVGEEAWEAANEQAVIGVAGESSIFATSQLTGSDKLADPTAVRRTGRGGQKARGANGGGGNGGAGRNGRGGGSGSGKQADAQASSGRKPRRRRSTKVGGEGAPAEGGEAPQKRRQKQSQDAGSGQKNGQGAQKKRQGGGSGGKKQGARGGDGQKRQGAAPKQKQGGPRPGQKSSGLRQGQGQGQEGAQPRAERERAGSGSGDGGGHRRARRRSHKAGGAGEGGAANGANEGA
ncbi:PSP1 domain-containing protein [Arabiibacter massiliensis]|uniref:PSP1 domain-containing protein n=1 Tax=Arabiibacter massiliensis TaxID=1870985 RepID=UPI0009BB5A5E|nr:regulatory iron-sulfur-containing complex subunit RicT [Arabiibacter massiliensis]